MKVKLCGFKEPATLQTAIDCGCDFVGIVFAEKSPRYLDPKQSKHLTKLIPKNIAKVAVSFEEPIEKLQEIYDNFTPQYFQIHNISDINYIEKVKKHFPKIGLILAFGVANSSDLQRSLIFSEYADFLLLDNKNPGSGSSFDWQLLEQFKSVKPWFLSGGLNINNLEEAINKTHAQYIDISSGIEIIRGTKSSQLIVDIMTKIKTLSKNIN